MNAATEGQVAFLRKFELGALCLGLPLLVIGCVFLVRSYLFVTGAVSADATVIDNQYTGDTGLDSSGGKRMQRLYRPTFRYTDQQGATHTVKFQHSSTEYSYDVGETVAIRYDPENPNTIRVASFFATWGASAIVSGLGLALTFASFLLKYSAKTLIAQHLQRQRDAQAQAP